MPTTFSALKIVSLTCSSWRATRLHKPETTRVNQDNHTEAARVTVKICQHPALTEIRALHAGLYQKHVSLTRPSIQDGMRLLPAGREFDHMEAVREARVTHDSLVSRFLADYNDELSNAPYRLNGLYDPTMWPDYREITGKFGIDVRYLGCPNDPSWHDWIKESSLQATSNLCDAIENAIDHIAKRCESDGKLHSSVFENLRDLLKEVPQFDCGLDDRLVRLASEAEYLASHDAESLRAMPVSRSNAATEAKRILDTLGAPPPLDNTSSAMESLFPAGSL